MLKPDNSITRITGFEQATEGENPILIYLQQDHYSGIQLKKGFKNLPQILNGYFSKDSNFIHPDEVQKIVTDMIAEAENADNDDKMDNEMKNTDNDDNIEMDDNKNEEEHDQNRNDGVKPGVTFIGDSDAESVQDMFPAPVKRKRGRPRK